MANNPNIILGAGQGRPESVDYNSARNIVQAGAALQSKQEQQDRQQAMQAQQAFQTALQQTGGDYDQAVGRLRSQGVNTIGIETELAKSRKATYDAIKSHYDATKSQHDTLSGLAGQITDEASWQQYAPEMMKVDPDLAPMISSHPHYDPNVVHGFMALGEAGNKILDRVQKGNEALLKGEYSTFMGNQLATTESQDDLDKVIQAGQSAAVPGFIMARVPKVWSPNVPAMGMSWAMTAKEKSDATDKAADNARQAANDAETVKQHGIQNKFEQQRVGLEGARVGMERQKMQQEQALNTQAMTAANPNAPHGDEFLKTLQPNIAAQVKALDEGRMQFPSSFALKTPYWQQMLSAVAQYDPNFDQVNYNARAKTRSDFTSGKSAQQVNALNTVIGHLDSLSQAASALNNTRFQSFNTLANYVASETGDPRVNNFKVTREAVADELTRVWRQAGGSEKDIEARKEQLSASNSPAQLHEAIAQIGSLLESKLDSMKEQYAQGTGTAPIEMVTPQARKTLSRLEQRAGKTTRPPASTGGKTTIGRFVVETTP